MDTAGIDSTREPRELASIASGVSLWWCELDYPSAAIAALAASLSPAEHARAARFGTDALRERWIAGRATLRRVLGHALRVPAADVPIVRGPRGRPELGAADAELDFNISHTGGVAVIGLLRTSKRSRRIGVDVERVTRELGYDRLARKFLTDAERAAIERLDPEERRRRFLRFWTCKEAMSKATGDGLLAPFRHIDVDLREGPRLVGGPEPYRPHAWTLVAAPVPQSHFATVALWDLTHPRASDTSSASAATENRPGSQGRLAPRGAQIAP
jgi:4'-phosphopantetheinyl transferase